MRIALLQLLPADCAEENRKKGEEYRRPEKYGLLVSEKIEAPFKRADRRK